MSRDHSWNSHDGKPKRMGNWLETIILMLIGLLIFLLAYLAVTQSVKEPYSNVRFGRNER